MQSKVKVRKSVQKLLKRVFFLILAAVLTGAFIGMPSKTELSSLFFLIASACCWVTVVFG